MYWFLFGQDVAISDTPVRLWAKLIPKVSDQLYRLKIGFSCDFSIDPPFECGQVRSHVNEKSAYLAVISWPGPVSDSWHICWPIGTDPLEMYGSK